jgi:hypothetical protein
MNILDDDLNIKERHNYQINIQNNADYNNYLKLLNLYYEKNGKKQKYNKYYLNGKYVLEEISNPAKKIYIEPARFVNMNILYIDLKKNIDNVLNKISDLIHSKNNITEDNRNEFDILKKKYILYKKNIESIDLINKEYYDDLNQLLLEKINMANNLAKYYQKREEVFKEIKVMIKETLKNKLIKIFKDNNKSIPSTSQINKIAKENNIPSNEIEQWFNWIETIYMYMKVKNELSKLNKLIELKENNYDILSKNMIIKEPVITK